MSGFRGYPREMVTFFEQLKRNNTKEWFAEHKKDYEAYVKRPSEDFVFGDG